MSRIPEYLSVAVAVHGAAVAIVNLTPTPRDNQALGNYSRMAVKLYRAIEILAGVVTPLVKR
jgi:pyridoxal biosynthesis lyase PdxS